MKAGRKLRNFVFSLAKGGSGLRDIMGEFGIRVMIGGDETEGE